MTLISAPPEAAPPVELAPETQAAVLAFARRLDPHDPVLAAFNDTAVPLAISDPTLPDCPLIYVNAAFEALTGFTADDVIGRNCRFLQGPLTVEADVALLRDAIARREWISVDLLNHRKDGTSFWNRLIVTPVFGEDGELRYFVASQLDVTIERHRMVRLQQDHATLAADLAERDAELAASDTQLSLALRAGGLGTWSFDPGTGELIASKSCKRAYGRPVDELFTYAQLVASIHPDDLIQQQAAVAETLASGAPLDIEYRILTDAGEQRWIAVQGEMQHRADGTPLALAGFATDISARKFAEEHRGVLARELTHRVKNTLATVSAVVSQTLRDATSIADARTAVAGRIASLGAAHELLVQDEVEGAAIGDIVERVLAPFIDRGRERFTIEGPNFRLSPELTLALSMALHELATNAVKYGALSNDQGRVLIRWRLEGTDAERRLCFGWIEEGGPTATPTSRVGFGTRMIDRVLSQHVQGSAKIAYPPEGARFEIEAPI